MFSNSCVLDAHPTKSYDRKVTIKLNIQFSGLLSIQANPTSLPFDRAWWLGCDVVDHPVDTFYFVDNTVGNML